LAIQVSQHGYIHFAEKDYSKCVLSSMTVCPFDSAIFKTRRLTCAASLFFQSPNSQHLCKRNLLLNHQQSTMIQHRNVWIYHFPTPRQLSLRYPGNEASPPRTQVLVNAGLLFTASAYHVSTEDLHIYPTLRGSMQTELDTPHVFLPDSPNNFTARVPPVTRADNADTPRAGQPTVSPRNTSTCKFLVALPSLFKKITNWNTLAQNCSYLHHYLLLGLLYFIIRSHFDKLRCATTKTQDTESANPPQNSLQQPRTPEPRPRNTERIVVFPTRELSMWPSTHIRMTLGARLQLQRLSGSDIRP
jgi:hypothetical protein